MRSVAKEICSSYKIQHVSDNLNREVLQRKQESIETFEAMCIANGNLLYRFDPLIQ